MSLLSKPFVNPYCHTLTDDYTTRLFTSWLLPPTLLFAYRALISLYAFVVLFFILAWDSTDDARYSFSYFTVLTYWGLAFYFAVAAAQTGALTWRGRSWLQGWWGPARYAHSVFYATVTVYPFIVTGEFSFGGA